MDDWKPAPRASQTEHARAITDAVQAGASIGEVARQFGITRQAVSQQCQRAGIVPAFRKQQQQQRAKTCPVCLAVFAPKYTQQTYCSHQCAGKLRCKDRDGMRPCHVCGEWKVLSEYYVANRKTGKLYSYCKPCFAQYRIERKRTAAQR